MRYGVISALALMVAACGQQGGGTAQPEATANATSISSVAEATEAAPQPAAKGRAEKEDTPLYQFAYSYPAAAAAEPGLRAILDQRLEKTRQDLIASAKSGKKEAEQDGFPYHAHSMDLTWKVVTDLPGWLSLSSEMYQYSGGAHGMSGYDTLLWDRGAEVARKPMDMFTSADALRAALRGPFCDALDKERAKKRGEPVQKNTDDMFSQCIDPTAQTLILGSSNKRTFDRIGILVAPYEAGPYAEGSYEVTLPVTGKVMAALKPQYRSIFSAQP